MSCDEISTQIKDNDKIKAKKEKNLPANSRTRHRRDNPRSSTTQESAPAELPLDDRRGVDQPLGRPDLLVCRQASGLQQRLDDVQGCGDTSRKGTGQPSGDAVGERIVFLPGVHELGERLVCDELRSGKGNGHAEGGGIGDVKGLEPFRAVDRPVTLPDTLVYGAMNLHALLDHYIPNGSEIGDSSQSGVCSGVAALTIERVHQCVTGNGGRRTTHSLYLSATNISPMPPRDTDHPPAASG